MTITFLKKKISSLTKNALNIYKVVIVCLKTMKYITVHEKKTLACHIMQILIKNAYI